MCKPAPRFVVAAAAACLLAAGWTKMETIVPTEVTPVVDGKVIEGEYEAWARGINKSFGDRIGQRSRLFMRSMPSGDLFIGLRSVNGFPDNEQDGAVMYIDSAPGGFASTTEFTDYSTVPRALVSAISPANRRCAVLSFPAEFQPDYALYIRYRDAGVFRLATDYHDLLAACQAQSTTGNIKYVHRDGTNLEVQVRLEDIGLTPDAPVKFVWTLLNGMDAYRSDEFIGVNALAGGSLGRKNLTLSRDDFMTYIPASAKRQSETTNGHE